ncbi:laminin subunit gamma-1-like isoform X2 [Bolinopsis microptera]|uniref:laminin subunit gamma-1-like isoform X2 n=1 Tax=Bolinopsis microptera TaxID=2820187 RepID=UPI0030799628
MKVFLSTLLIFLSKGISAETGEGSCYNPAGEAVRCMPDFINIAFRAQVFASNTCGDPPSQYCVQQETGVPNLDDENCYECDAGDPDLSHPTTYLTDRNEVDNQTSWQSNTLYDQNIGNMTLHLPFNKSFDIEYIKIEFQSPRPESMVIEKSSDYGRNWEVYQYFSSTCYKTFNKRTDEEIYPWDEAKAICTDKYSEISPLQGGVVAFSPLKDRPGAKETEQLFNNPALLAWMRATDIRIRLINLNTFGDQYFSNAKNEVMKTYYYSISDLSVGGRCTCHGHGEYCTTSACECLHNTAGKNCERCLDMFNDLPWREATTENPFVCQECDCNGLASRCVFDQQVFDDSESVSGGVCVGCRANTAGQHCDECAHGFFPNPELAVGHVDRCRACQCNVYGSVGDGACTQTLDVNRGLSFGDCQCKPNVLGVNCDTCADGYHSLQEGCLRCDCDPVGTKGNHKLCDKATGQCRCRNNIAGLQCNECLPGYYGYLTGCEPCSCNLAGSFSKECDQDSGQCQCRDGYEGKECANVEQGTFIPDMGSLVIQPAESDNLIDGGDGDSEDSTSTSTMPPDDIQDDPSKLSKKGDEVNLFFVPPRDDEYILVLQYSYPMGPNARIRFTLTALDTPEDIMPICEAKQVQFWSDELSTTNGVGVFKIRKACMDDNTRYHLKVELLDDLPGEITIGGVILLPQPTPDTLDRINDLFPDTEEGQAARDYCMEIIFIYPRPVLLEQFPDCVPVYDIVVPTITDGTVRCNCDRDGAYEPDRCELEGGQCSCKPNVQGLKCDECKPSFFNLGPNGCEACGCSLIGSENQNCDQESGECKCKPGVMGDQCDQCEPTYYGYGMDGCATCGCSSTGSTSMQCDAYGQCPCKPGIGGIQCDRCDDGHYDFSVTGCKQCDCSSIGGSNLCDPDTGDCRCKENVEGDKCMTCKDNAFSLQQSNPEGCQACFCFGHTEECVADTTFTPKRVISDFERKDEGWMYKVAGDKNLLPVEHSPVQEHIRVTNEGDKPQTFCLFAPKKYIGNQLSSFLTKLKFMYNIKGSQSSITQIVIRGEPYTLTLIPRANPGDKYNILMHPSESWLVSDTGNDDTKSDQYTSSMFQSVIGDITSMEICATVYQGESIRLEEFSIGGVEKKSGRKDKTAYNIESCDCPLGYDGSSCEECAAGYRRTSPEMGQMSPCERCDCNSYSNQCDPISGQCLDCQHNTAGDSCEVCEDGYYGNPGYGNPRSCKKCQCPEADRSFSNTCEIQDGSFVCTNCTLGHAGDRCEVCADGFFGEPSYDNPNQVCTECTCNDNIDPDAENNCNTITGQCLKCIGNTAGRYCEECARGYFGDAIDAKNCAKCDCDPDGSNNMYLCDIENGQCDCKPNVVGHRCDSCKPGYYDLASGDGCEACECDLLGSSDLQCSEDGSCLCNAGYFGMKCNECSAGHYYDPIVGCAPCNCNAEGSESQQCDSDGQCDCKGTVQGKQCDICPSNMFDISEGCLNCPDCYSLVDREVDLLKVKLEELKEIMSDVDAPTIEASPDFKNQIEEVQEAVRDTFAKANETAALAEKLSSARGDINVLIETLKNEMEDTNGIVDIVSSTVDNSERKLENANDAIDDIKRQLDEGVKMLLEEGKAALQRAEDNMSTLSDENTEMQKKANQARRIAQEQETKSQETVAMALEAEELSTSALDTAKSARNTLRDTQDKLDDLTTDLGELKEEYELAKSAATKYISSAEDTLQAATQLKEAACSASGNLDLEALKGSLAALDKKAKAAADDAIQLQERANEMKKTADSTIETAEGLLAEGEEADTGMTQLKTKADEALLQSQQAVQECAELINDAQKLLEVLQNFEREVELAKGKAESAVAELDDLEDALDAAESKVQAAGKKLGDGKRDMEGVLDSIKSAKGNLESSLENAREVTGKISELLGGSQTAADDAETLNEDVAAALEEVRRLRNEAANGTSLLKEVLKKAADSKANANSFASTVDAGDRKLKNLQRQLDDIDSLDAARLQELIDELTQADQKMDEAGIDDKIAEMKQISSDQDDKIAYYRSQILMMREEILTLEKIEAELPDDTECYNPNNV